MRSRTQPSASNYLSQLGAICDLGPERSADERSENFSVSEFVTLEAGPPSLGLAFRM